MENQRVQYSKAEASRLLGGLGAIGFATSAINNAAFPLTRYLEQNQGFSDHASGWIIGSLAAAQVVSLLIFGFLSNRFEKPILFVAAGLFILSTLLLLPGTFAFFIASRVVAGIACGSVVTAFVIVSRRTLPEERAKGFGNIVGKIWIGAAMGIGLAGPALQDGGIPRLVLGLLAMNLWVLLEVVRMPKLDAFRDTTKPLPPMPIAEVIGNPPLLISLLLSVLIASSFTALLTAGNLIIAKHLDGMSSKVDVLSASMNMIAAFGVLLFRLPFLQRKNDGGPLIVLLLVVAGVAFLPSHYQTTEQIFLVLTIVSTMLSLGDAFLSSLVSKISTNLALSIGLSLSFAAGATGRFLGATFVAPTPAPFVLASILALTATLTALVLYKYLEERLKNDSASD